MIPCKKEKLLLMQDKICILKSKKNIIGKKNKKPFFQKYLRFGRGFNFSMPFLLEKEKNSFLSYYPIINITLKYNITNNIAMAFSIGNPTELYLQIEF